MKNLKILLMCSAGTSTSLLVAKMQEYCEDNGKEYTIDAMGVETGKQVMDEWDVLLLGPQLQFQIDSIRSLTTKRIEVIPPQIYGLVDGQAAVELAEEIYNESK